MKLVIGTVATVSGVLFALSMASANPSLLPKHEGYPMKNSGSPVTGQPTANDPGQSDARGESTLMKSADSIKSAQRPRVFPPPPPHKHPPGGGDPPPPPPPPPPPHPHQGGGRGGGDPGGG